MLQRRARLRSGIGGCSAVGTRPWLRPGAPREAAVPLAWRRWRAGRVPVVARQDDVAARAGREMARARGSGESASSTATSVGGSDCDTLDSEKHVHGGARVATRSPSETGGASLVIRRPAAIAAWSARSSKSSGSVTADTAMSEEGSSPKFAMPLGAALGRNGQRGSSWDGAHSLESEDRNTAGGGDEGPLGSVDARSLDSDEESVSGSAEGSTSGSDGESTNGSGGGHSMDRGDARSSAVASQDTTGSSQTSGGLSTITSQGSGGGRGTRGRRVGGGGTTPDVACRAPGCHRTHRHTGQAIGVPETDDHCLVDCAHYAPQRITLRRRLQRLAPRVVAAMSDRELGDIAYGRESAWRALIEADAPLSEYPRTVQRLHPLRRWEPPTGALEPDDTDETGEGAALPARGRPAHVRWWRRARLVERWADAFVNEVRAARAALVAAWQARWAATRAVARRGERAARQAAAQERRTRRRATLQRRRTRAAPPAPPAPAARRPAGGATAAEGTGSGGGSGGRARGWVGTGRGVAGAALPRTVPRARGPRRARGRGAGPTPVPRAVLRRATATAAAAASAEIRVRWTRRRQWGRETAEEGVNGGKSH